MILGKIAVAAKAIGVGVLAWLMLAPVVVSAQEKKAEETRIVRFGVVDVEEIEQKSRIQQDIKAQINDLRKKLSEEVKQEEADLRKASEELQRQKVLLSPDAFEQEVRKFRQKEQEFQKKIQERNNDFNRVRVHVTNAFNKALNQALVAITKEHQFTLILRRSQVLTVADFLDITSLVLEKLNEQSPSYKIPEDLTKLDE